MSEHRTAADETVDTELDDVDAETVEDLDVDDDAEQVLGGTMHCPTA